MQWHLLIRSEKVNHSTGFKGVAPHKDRYQVQCTKAPCRHNFLGVFSTAEEGAETYLQHQQESHSYHPESGDNEVEEEKDVVAEQHIEPYVFKSAGDKASSKRKHQLTAMPGDRRVFGMQEEEVTNQGTTSANLDESEKLIRSSFNMTGFKGVHPHGPHRDRYQAQCNTPPCSNNHLGTFFTPEEGAQAYLQHYQKEHPEELQHKREHEGVQQELPEDQKVREDRVLTHKVREAARRERVDSSLTTLRELLALPHKSAKDVVLESTVRHIKTFNEFVNQLPTEAVREDAPK